MHPICSTSPPQVAILSNRDGSGSGVGFRDRGRSTRRERDVGRQRSSRSLSPRDRNSRRKFRKDSPDPEAYARSACPVCLSRKRHHIRQCRALTLWNNKDEARCSRTADGYIVDKAGRTLCSDWNQIIGCAKKSSQHIHECSGCGKTSHGAQDCSLAEKAPSAHAVGR
jgi:hypothetical protein